jgi:glycerate kinase
MQILIAPNAFKNSLSSEDAAEAIKAGLLQSKLDCSCECFPIADGGDGTGSLIIEKCKGTLVHLNIQDPLKRMIRSSYGLIDNGQTAIIEMADASGLRLLSSDELNPLIATSFGTGEMIRNALDKGVKKIIVAMGGSATVDGGCGILSALGIRFLDNKEQTLSGLPASLVDLEKIDLSEFDARILNCELVVLCDVDNRLLGEKGSAAVFGPQKGATDDGVKILEAALSKFRDVVLHQTGKDIAEVEYGGTAGGAAAGLYAFLNAKLVNGISYFLELTGFDDSLNSSDLVITGEGSIDEQTLNGKGPFGVAYRAKLKNIPVVGLAGKIPLEENQQISSYFNVLLAIGNEVADLETALSQTAENLTRTSRELGNLLQLLKE